MGVGAAASHGPGQRRAVAGLLTLICIAGALIRFWWLGREGFWLDEMYTGVIVQQRDQGVLGIARMIFAGDVHPPLYYILVAGWAGLFGDGEYALRSFSALVGSLTAPAALWALRGHLRPAGLVVLALAFVTVPALLQASQQARVYPLLILVATIAAAWVVDLVLAPAWDRAARRRQVALTLLLLVGCWLHYFALIVALGAGLVLLWRWRREPVALAWLAGCGVVGLAGILPWLLPHAMAHPGALGPGGTWINPLPLPALRGLLTDLTGAKEYLRLICVASLLAAAVLLPWRALTACDRRRIGAMLGFFVAMLGLGLAAALFAPALSQRTVAALAPPLLIALAVAAQYGLAAAGRGRRIGFAVALGLVLLAPALDGLRWVSTPRFPQWRESTRLIFSWPGCRDAEIATYHVWGTATYYLERFGIEANPRFVELGAGDPESLVASLEDDPDCPVAFWGVRAKGEGWWRAARAMREARPELVPVRMRKILILVEPDTPPPSGYGRGD